MIIMGIILVETQRTLQATHCLLRKATGGKTIILIFNLKHSIAKIWLCPEGSDLLSPHNLLLFLELIGFLSL